MRSGRRTAAGATRRRSRRVRARRGCAARTSTWIPKGCALARSSSEVVGVGFAHPRGAVTSIGPLASRPGAPAGVARALMRAARRDRRGASTSVRLFQDSFNPDSFGLYTRLGYAVADVAPYLLAEKLEPPAPGTVNPAVRPLAARRPAGDRTLRPIAHRRRPAARPRAAGIDGRRLRVSRRGRAARSPATCSFARCRRASSSARRSRSRPRSWRHWSTASPRACRDGRR